MEAVVRSTEHKKEPARTCAGCRAAGSKYELVRVVLGDDGQIVVDLGASAFGRGAWLHPRTECIGLAAPRGLAKSFKHEVKTSPAELAKAIALAAHRRVLGLLSSAKKTKRLVAGSTAAIQEIEAERAMLVVVASDARAAAESQAVQRMIAGGRAASWGTKATLGAALGRGETGVIAVLDRGIARALSGAIALTHVEDLLAGIGTGSRKAPAGRRKGQAFPEEG